MRNPHAQARWQDWLAESWSFEQRAIAAGVTAPRPGADPGQSQLPGVVSRRDPALLLTRHAVPGVRWDGQPE